MNEKSEKIQVKLPDDAVWAIGGKRSQSIHLYINKKAYENKVPLCGRRIIPLNIIEHLDLSDDTVRKHLCKDCMEMFKFLPYTDIVKKKHEQK